MSLTVERTSLLAPLIRTRPTLSMPLVLAFVQLALLLNLAKMTKTTEPMKPELANLPLPPAQQLLLVPLILSLLMA